MAISKQLLTKARAEYEAGKLTKSKIADKYEISRKTLRTHAEKERWVYGLREQEINEDIRQKTFDKIADGEAQKAADLAQGFLADVGKQKTLLNTIQRDFATSISEQQGRLSKADAGRIFEAMKVNKITMETLLMGFTGAMKALGIYRDIIDLRSGDGSLTPESPQNSIERTIELVKKAMDRGIDADKITSVSNDN